MFSFLPSLHLYVSSTTSPSVNRQICSLNQSLGSRRKATGTETPMQSYEVHSRFPSSESINTEECRPHLLGVRRWPKLYDDDPVSGPCQLFAVQQKPQRGKAVKGFASNLHCPPSCRGPRAEWAESSAWRRLRLPNLRCTLMDAINLYNEVDPISRGFVGKCSRFRDGG